MDLAQFSEFVLDWELTDTDVNLLMELLSVVGIDLLHDVASNCV